MKINYQKLKEEIEKILPEKYKTGIVKEYILSVSNDDLTLAKEGKFPSYHLYWDKEYVVRDAKDPETIYEQKKGDTYLARTLHIIKKYGDEDLIPTMFIYTFFKSLMLDELVETSKLRYENVREILGASTRDIRNANYAIAHSQFTSILPLYYETYPFFITAVESISKCKTENELATVIVNAIDNILSSYIYEYRHYPEEVVRAVTYHAINKAFPTT